MYFSLVHKHPSLFSEYHNIIPYLEMDRGARDIFDYLLFPGISLFIDSLIDDVWFVHKNLDTAQIMLQKILELAKRLGIQLKASKIHSLKSIMRVLGLEYHLIEKLIFIDSDRKQKLLRQIDEFLESDFGRKLWESLLGRINFCLYACAGLKNVFKTFVRGD